MAEAGGAREQLDFDECRKFIFYTHEGNFRALIIKDCNFIL